MSKTKSIKYSYENNNEKVFEVAINKFILKLMTYNIMF